MARKTAANHYRMACRLADIDGCSLGFTDRRCALAAANALARQRHRNGPVNEFRQRANCCGRGKPRWGFTIEQGSMSRSECPESQVLKDILNKDSVRHRPIPELPLNREIELRLPLSKSARYIFKRPCPTRRPDKWESSLKS